MMKNRVLSILLLVSFSVFAQNIDRKLTNAKFKNGVLEVTVNDGVYRITPVTEQIFETSFVPKDQSYKEKSHAVVLESQKVHTEFKQTKDFVYLNSEGLQVQIQKSPFQIKYFYKGEQVISEKTGYYKTEYHEALNFNLTTDEILYGGGARALGMNRRGYKLKLYNRAHYGYEKHSELMNFTLPIVISSKKYMVHFDNAPIGYLDLDSQKNNTLAYETISGRKTYQVIVADSWLQLIDNYTELTGRQPMLPRWALGNFSSRFGYHTQKETEDIIGKFKQEKIPVDAVILDLYWFGKDVKGHMGNLAPELDSFPDMKGMVSNFEKQGVKTVLISEPFILTTSKRWDEAVANDALAKDSIGNPFKYDFFFGNTGLVDIYNPKGEKWFWNKYKDIIDIGIHGIWGDLGEPEVHPEALRHFGYTANEVHNIYGHDWSRLVFEGYERDYPNQRPFILMRAGYSGSQRYGLVPWSGDVNRTWGGLHNQVEIALQMAMQGLGYMHSDLGGFAGANLDDELYVRWLQYGVFQPIYRPHAQEEVPSEPVLRSEKAKSLAKEAIELRYRMLPYNYNLVFQNNQKGTPLMRPLFFEDENQASLKNSSTYLWGKDFLISPVIYQGKKEQTVTFPKNSDWVNFYTDEIVKGGVSKTVPLNENNIPTYVRSGTFVLMTPVVQTTDNYTGNKFDLHYYYNASETMNSRSFYNDDGKTPNSVEKKKYELLRFMAKASSEGLEVKYSAIIGRKWKMSDKSIQLFIHNYPKKPKSVRVNGKNVNFIFIDNTIKISTDWNTSKVVSIQIK